jgi:hypothetical protein
MDQDLVGHRRILLDCKTKGGTGCPVPPWFV